MKRDKRAYVNLYGMDGYGSTKAEAKQDAESKLIEAMEGDYAPHIFRFPAGYVGLVIRLPIGGWQYTILGPEDTVRCGASCSGIETAYAAERTLRLHIAQNLIFVTEDNGLEVLKNETDKANHKAYIAWQLRYKEYRAQGYSDTDAHRLACESRAFCPTAA